MRILGNATEQEMVATFLQAEINSDRWGQSILDLLARDGLNRSLVDAPNVMDAAENACRARILGDFRGYGQSRDLFDPYPDPTRIVWQWVTLDHGDLARIRYIDYDYWNDLSGGTRSPVAAARNIRNGIQSCQVPNDGFWRAAQALQSGARFPPLILVATDAPDPARAAPVVLEGHVRLTAYLLAAEQAPPEVAALWGTSPDFAPW